MVNGDKIRELRKQMSMSTVELAKAVYVSNVMITYIENNKKNPSLELLIRIADYFGVKLDDLVLKVPHELH